MPYRETIPVPALRPFVDRFWTRTREPTSAAGNPEATPLESSWILPDGCMDVIVRMDGGGEARLVGAMTRAERVAPLGAAQLAAVRFRPGGAAASLQLDADELTDRTVPLDELVRAGRGRGRRSSALEAWLDESPTTADRSRRASARRPGGAEDARELDARAQVHRGVAALERWLLQRLSSVAPPDRLVTRASARLFSAAPPSVSELARELGTSRQHLRRLVLRHVGLAPKELARVARLQHTVAYLQRLPDEPLARAALHLGYFDQAHLARELRLLAGVTATAVRAEAGSIFPIHSLLGR
jgi:AraC-like DNA-binding protein